MSRVIDLWHTLALAMSGYHMSEKLKFSRRLQNKTQINKGSILLSIYIHKDVSIIAETHYLRWISVFMAFGLREFLICHKSSVFRSSAEPSTIVTFSTCKKHWKHISGADYVLHFNDWIKSYLQDHRIMMNNL